MHKKELNTLLKEKVMASLTPAPTATPQSAPPAGAHPAQTTEEEEKSRTITFGNWPAGTDSHKIFDVIHTHMKENKEDLDEDDMFACLVNKPQTEQQQGSIPQH